VLRDGGGNGSTPARSGSADVLGFVTEQTCERVVVFDAAMAIVFKNDRAALFLESHAFPEEIPALVQRLFTAIACGKAVEQFPGRICFRQEVGGRRWLFRLAFREGDRPLVGVYFSDETVSSRFDLNFLRRQYRLTRRETDVLRNLLDGQKNHEIAEALAITEQTVKEYLSSIYGKVGAPDRFALLRLLVCLSQE